MDKRIKRIEEKIDNLEKAAFVSLRGVRAILTLGDKKKPLPSEVEKKGNGRDIVKEIDKLLSSINKRNWPDFCLKPITAKNAIERSNP